MNEFKRKALERKAESYLNTLYSIRNTMVKTYFKIAWRNLQKTTGYSAINVIGLAIGMTAAILIALWVQSENTFDRFYSKTNRIYQVFSRDIFEGKKHAWGRTSALLAPTLKAEYPEIEEAVRTTGLTEFSTFRVGDKKLIPNGLAADSGFFNLFDFQFLAGDRQQALSSLNDVVITRSLAIKLFGKTDALGKLIAFDTLANLVVKAVIEDIPDNSRFKGVEYISTWPLLEKMGWVSYSSWSANNHETFVLLRQHAQLSEVNHKIENTLRQHSGGRTRTGIFLHPAEKWHLYNKSENGEMVAGRLQTVRLFTVIAFLILLIACINFVNLSTARSEKRAKEVGIRKVVGAQKTMLIAQFLTESILLAFLSGLLALLFTLVLLPFFNQIVQKQLMIVWDVRFMLAFAFFIFFTGTLAGLYPAFFLSSFQPIKTLKGTLAPITQVYTPRKVLVILQFVCSITLIICTIVIKKQIAYGQNRESGYDKNNLIYTALRGDVDKNYALIKQDLIQKGAAIAVSKSLGPITRYTSNGWGFSWPGSVPEDYDVVFYRLSSEADFTKTMQVQLVAGRDIDIEKFPSDSSAILLNETAVKKMHLKDPIGAKVIQGKGEAFAETWHVVGVIKDFILTSPYEPVEPLMVCGPGSWFNYMHIKLNPKNSVAKNLEIAKKIFTQYNPNYPFDYTFADEAYAQKFVDEQRTGILIGLFSGLTILIACLGLFGLAAYTAEQRTKEVGIRKVLGARVGDIAFLISKDFIKLVVVALVISSPMAWWIMQMWLNHYTYRVTISGTVFLLTGLIALLIVTATVAYQVIKAALANPVESLRNE